MTPWDHIYITISMHSFTQWSIVNPNTGRNLQINIKYVLKGFRMNLLKILIWLIKLIRNKKIRTSKYMLIHKTRAYCRLSEVIIRDQPPSSMFKLINSRNAKRLKFAVLTTEAWYRVQKIRKRVHYILWNRIFISTRLQFRCVALQYRCSISCMKRMFNDKNFL